MLNCDDLARLWILLAALYMSEVPIMVKDDCESIMRYLERISKEL